MKFDFSPSQRFLKEAKARYLAVFDARYPAPRLSWYVMTAKVASAALAVVAVLFGTVSVYADTTNVPAESPFYPLKRFNESVRLAVALPQQKAQLQASFAERRLTELNDLEVHNPSSTRIGQLTEDADDAVSASIAVTENARVEDGALTSICDRLLGAISTSSLSLTMQGKLEGHSDILARFTKHCEAVQDGSKVQKEQPADEGNVTATVSSAGAPTVIAPAPQEIMSPAAPENQHDGHDENMVVAASSTEGETSSSGTPWVDLQSQIRSYLNLRHGDQNAADESAGAKASSEVHAGADGFLDSRN